MGNLIKLFLNLNDSNQLNSIISSTSEIKTLNLFLLNKMKIDYEFWYLSFQISFTYLSLCSVLCSSQRLTSSAKCSSTRVTRPFSLRSSSYKCQRFSCAKRE